MEGIRTVLVLMALAIGFPGHGTAQCDLIQFRDLHFLSRASYKKRVAHMNQRNARLSTIRGDRDKCEYRTYTLCKNFISNTEWHWVEIVSFNSCDKILTYSTSQESHYRALKGEFLTTYESFGSRTYEGLEFLVYQDRRGRVIEFDEHPNPQGLTFYLINVIGKSRKR